MILGHRRSAPWCVQPDAISRAVDRLHHSVLELSMTFRTSSRCVVVSVRYSYLVLAVIVNMGLSSPMAVKVKRSTRGLFSRATTVLCSSGQDAIDVLRDNVGDAIASIRGNLVFLRPVVTLVALDNLYLEYFVFFREPCAFGATYVVSKKLETKGSVLCHA